jgi:hypothetical protein
MSWIGRHLLRPVGPPGDVAQNELGLREGVGEDLVIGTFLVRPE